MTKFQTSPNQKVVRVEKYPVESFVLLALVLNEKGI